MNEPIESSADGKRNAFHHHCAIAEGNKAYAVCLHLCEKRKEGALPVIYSECSVAIGKKTCPALKMRREEIEKGHAIYFIERLKGLATRIFSAPAPKQKSKSRVTNKEPVVTDIVDSGNYADAITSAMAAEKDRAPDKPAIETPKVESSAGESLLEMAKRIMNEKGVGK